MRLLSLKSNHLPKKLQLASVAFIGIFFLAFSSSPPVGNTNAPGNGSCGNCHGGGSFSGDLMVDIFDNGTDIQFVTEFDTGVPTTFGWQWTILDDNNNPIGSWTSLPGNSSVITSGGQEYMGHDPAIFDGGGLWITDGGFWDPQGYCGDITIYTATLTANGNGNTGGDEVHHDIFTHTIACSLMGVFGDFAEPTCNGDCDGFIVADGVGGTPPYMFEWDDGQTTATAQNLCAGDYTVTITDDIGDEFVMEMTLDEPDEVIGEETGLENAGCFGESNGLIQVTASGGTGSLDFDWGPFGNTCCPTGLSAGTYGVTITDALGCEFIDSYEITENPELFLTLSSTTPVPVGASNGSATATVTGGTPPYEYDWDTGDDTATITGLEAGIYVVTVTDDEFCSVEATIEVMEGLCDLSISNVVIVNPTCYGEEGEIIVDVMGGAQPIDFDWSDGSQGSVLTNVAGSYSVIITDDAGCVVDTSGLIITQPDSLDVALTSLTGATCPGGSDGGLTVSVLGGSGDYTLTWENGLTNDTIVNGVDTLINIQDTLTNLSTGYFSYTLTDGNGCLRVDSFLIEGNDAVPPNLTTQTALVYLDEMGVAAPVSVDEVVDTATDNCGIMSIEITSGATSYSCADIGSAMVTVTATDTNNNMVTQTALVTVLDTLAPVLSCPQSFTVSTCIAVDYDLPIVTDNCDQGLSPILTAGLSSGSAFPSGTTIVSYEATDLCGNTGQCSFEITVEIDLNLSALSSPATCGLMDGMITLLATGGTPPYTFEPDLSTGVAAGTYTVAVFDSAGCQAETTVVVEQVGGPQISGVTAVSFCPGSIPMGSLEVNGGVAPYNITVDGVAVNNVAGPLVDYVLPGVGTFNVTLVDANGCASNSILVEAMEFQVMQISVADIDLVCAASIPASQVELPAGFMLEGNPSTLTPGTYTIVDNLCGVSSGTLNVTGGGMLMVDATTTPTSCNGATGSVMIDVSGGIEPYTFTPFGPDQGGLGAGSYSITIGDMSGCQVVVDFTIVQENGPSITVDESIVCFGANNGELTVTGSGGTPPYSYQLGSGTPVMGNGLDPFTFDGLAPGAYNVSIIDANGCSAEFPAVVREHPELMIMAEADPGTDCILEIDELIISPTGGVMPYDVQTEIAADGLSIVVTVVDGVGCSVTEQILLEEQAELQASALVAYDCNDSTPLIEFNIAGGCPPYSSDFDATLNTEVGDHIITITDSAGNMTQVTITIEDIGVLDLSAPALIEVTSGDPINLESSVTGGVAPYEFTWSDADGNVLSEDQTLDTDGLASQIITVLVVDDRGCAVSMEVELTITVATIELDTNDELVKVYPSPVTDVVTISVAHPASVDIQMLDMTGQRLIRKRTAIRDTKIDVSELAPGVYLVRMEFEDRIILKRFIKG